MTARVAILADYLEEGWTSMDHYVAMLSEHLTRSGHFEPWLVRPRFQRRLGCFPWLFGPRHGHTLDRYWNRYLDYPRTAACLRGAELFHVVDQTYSHIVTRLPAGRTLVTCHDLDFADPPSGTRQAWLVRATGARTLPGLRAAARVICDSEVVRQDILRRGLVEPERLAVVPLGVEDEFTPEGPAALPPPAEAQIAGAGPGPMLLHVGGMVSRKRIDLLLRSVALIRRQIPTAFLVRAGGALSPAMRLLAQQLGIEHAIVTMPFLARTELAALYRRADVFLLSSDSEGFGLPVIEAMASGLPVVARDIPTVREVAGDAIRHVAGDDPAGLAAAVADVLRDGGVRLAMRQMGLDRAAAYRWERTAESTGRIYQEVLDSLGVRATSGAAARP